MNLALFDLDHTLLPIDSDYEWGQFLVRTGAVDAAALGVQHLIAAMPQRDAEGNITGKLLDSPTQGHGKVVHTKAWLGKLGHTLDGFERSYFYSDSHNDLPLLSVVTHPVATNPNAALSIHASKHGWPSLHLFND